VNQSAVVSLPSTSERQRVVYVLLQGGGYSNPVYRFRWGCPACGVLVDEETRPKAQRAADDHRCAAGWCALDVASLSARAGVGFGERLYASTQERPGGLLPSTEDRERWQRARQARRR